MYTIKAESGTISPNNIKELKTSSIVILIYKDDNKQFEISFNYEIDNNKNIYLVSENNQEVIIGYSVPLSILKTIILDVGSNNDNSKNEFTIGNTNLTLTISYYKL